ncbi:hypothetical protein ACPOL_5405 [Acidisarcina polymorpha]|uniref:Cupin type-1 domain-containing protein n=1 Tax=Acidisarcina polymorpha TaxID=2211140 RepID=A0A2Z5G5Y4_9BACT|nr:hypothetical protein [Acidisarcina polymorpha]AXC14653.1 hypothetical protein ACPOL_5405 [Acidisarcina polymorpha]
MKTERFRNLTTPVVACLCLLITPHLIAQNAKADASPATGSFNVDSYTPEQLRQKESALASEAAASGISSEILAHYPGHYTMLAYRDRSGQAEVHEKLADVFIIIRGSASLQSGGRMVAPTTTVSPGEEKGPALENYQERALHAGDIVHIPAGEPHRMTLEKGATILYFVVKVQESSAP